MKKAIVIGSGAAGATVARELQGKFEVTVLEAGKSFRPFPYPIEPLASLRKSGLFFDEREIQLLFPAMKIRKTAEKMVLVNGIATGGTTTISTGNAIRVDRDLKKIGIDLSKEFEEIDKEIPITTSHKKHWNKTTQKIYQVCKDMELNPQPTPKMGNYEHCKHCGRCILGCKFGIKWDSRKYLKDAISKGAKLVTSCNVTKIAIENGKVIGVFAKKGLSKHVIPADLIVLSAGGLGTPVILQKSGIKCKSRLFVDPVLCVAAVSDNAILNKEVAMPFFVQKDHFMISPYFDFLSFFFNKKWLKPADNILSLMIKLSDVNEGSILDKKVDKTLTAEDKKHLQEAVDLCVEIFGNIGINKQNTFLGTLNAGHPGGMFPLTENESETFHHASLPENLYIADASLLPKSLGKPPILTIIALAKRVSNIIKQFS